MTALQNVYTARSFRFWTSCDFLSTFARCKVELLLPLYGPLTLGDLMGIRVCVTMHWKDRYRTPSRYHCLPKGAGNRFCMPLPSAGAAQLFSFRIENGAEKNVTNSFFQFIANRGTLLLKEVGKWRKKKEEKKGNQKLSLRFLWAREKWRTSNHDSSVSRANSFALQDESSKCRSSWPALQNKWGTAYCTLALLHLIPACFPLHRRTPHALSVTISSWFFPEYTPANMLSPSSFVQHCFGTLSLHNCKIHLLS